MFIITANVISGIHVINKVLDWHRQQLVLAKGKGKGKDKQAFIIICICC